MPNFGRHLVALLFCACGSGDPNVIATQQLDLIDIEARTGAVYWATTRTIVKSSNAGGSLMTLASGFSDPAIPTAMWVDDTDVYWTDSNSLFAVSVSGGAPRTLASTQAMGVVGSLTGDATDIYIASVFGIWKVAKSGGSPVALVTFPKGIVPSPFGIAVDDTNVYWTDAGNISFATALNNGSVARASKDGGPPTVIAANQAYPAGIASDGASVFWVNGGDNSVVPCTQDCVDGALMTSRTDSPSPTVLVSDPVVGSKLVMQAGFIYWISGAALLRVATTGGSVETVDAGLSAIFTADDTNVYFGYGSMNDGDIHKMPLP